MDKLTMAHDVLLKLIETNKTGYDAEGIAGYSWEIADAMQAEADKRKEKGFPEVLNSTNSSKLEWQPDWSVAPDGFNWWALDGFSNKANWFNVEPYLDDDSLDEEEWNIDLIESNAYKEAPLFNYKGDWRNSLRKRPVMNQD